MALSCADINRSLDDVARPVLAYLCALHASIGGLTEVRIVTPGRVWAARIGPDDVDAMVDAVRPIFDAPRARVPNDDYPRAGESNLYLTLGAVRPDAPGNNGLPLRRASDTAKDCDIVGSPWVVVDVDPERKPKGRSATDDEKAAALDVAVSVREAFAARGVASALADSGNGWHLLVRTLPTTGSAVATHASHFKQLLHALDARYSTSAAKVDRSIHNPGRIIKWWGTPAVKGGDTPDAPHRLSALNIVDIPAEVDIWPLLDDLMTTPSTAPSAAPSAAAPAASAASSGPGRNPAWDDWRRCALDALDLKRAYGDYLTGAQRRGGWLECRDPGSPSGDKHASAGVMDRSGQVERGTFHSFRTSESMSVFDFLVRQDQAPDFVAACALIAEWTGVALPSTARHAPTIDVESFTKAWGTADLKARPAALEDALRKADTLPAIERAPLLERLRAATGIDPKTFQAAVAEAKRANAKARRSERAQRPATVRQAIAVVDYFVNRDMLCKLKGDIATQAVRVDRFFQSPTGLQFVHKGVGTSYLDERNLPGRLSAYVEVGYHKIGEDGPEFLRFGPLNQELSRTLVHCPRFRASFPLLRAYVRSPVFCRDWELVATPGWNPAAETFYDGVAICVVSGTTALDGVTRGFRWKEDADRVGFIGALLTMVTIPHWSQGNHPFVAINGNKPGVGKSTLARVLAAIVEGKLPPTTSYNANDEEFEKQIATRVEAGDRVIIIDNAKSATGISSPVLERSVTDAQLSYRRLGSNTLISRPENDVLFVLTANTTQLGTDLRRRALPLNLEVLGSVRQATYTVDDPVRLALSTRDQVLGELLHLVTSWLGAGRPMPPDPARHSAGQTWAATIDAILRNGGLPGFLSNFEASEHAFDPKFALMVDVITQHFAFGGGHAKDWAPVLREGALREQLHDRTGRPRPERGQSTIIGNLFQQYVDEEIDTPVGKWALREERPRGQPCYRLERLIE